MELVGVVFIATNHFLAVAPFPSTMDGPRLWSGRSAPIHQRMKLQRSVVTAISTATSASDVRQCSRKRSCHAPRMVHEDAKNAFYRTRHLRVFWYFNARTVCASQTVRAWFRTVLASPLDDP
jgi:hypothetical protein